MRVAKARADARVSVARTTGGTKGMSSGVVLKKEVPIRRDQEGRSQEFSGGGAEPGVICKL